MKKYLLLLTLLFGFKSLYAQHISFMGIQLGQSEKIVDRMLLQKGFVHPTLNGNILPTSYKGAFWKYQDSRLYTEVEDGKVTSVQVWPPYECNKMSDYNSLVRNLDNKYGRHYNIKYVFTHDNDFTSTDGGACWLVTGGFIVVYYVYNPGNRNEIAFRIRYIDKTNKRVILEKGRKRNTDNDL